MIFKNNSSHEHDLSCIEAEAYIEDAVAYVWTCYKCILRRPVFKLINNLWMNPPHDMGWCSKYWAAKRGKKLVWWTTGHIAKDIAELTLLCIHTQDSLRYCLCCSNWNLNRALRNWETKSRLPSAPLPRVKRACGWLKRRRKSTGKPSRYFASRQK